MDKAKDFEKGWEEYKAKKKQEIEEMARTTCNYNAKNFESCVECIKGGLLSCDRLVQAEKLYNAGYRKIPENAVVLTREEYEKLKLFEERVRSGVCFTQKEWFDYCQKDSNERTSLLIKAKKDTRKETAEKFAEKVKKIKIRIDLIGKPYEKKYTQADLKEVANGVLNHFLRYIDEIAKEITEGKGNENG